VAEANIHIDSTTFASQAAAENWAAALPLYQGEFLAGFHLREAPEFEEWALMQRERLRLLAVEGLQKLVSDQQRQGDYWSALQTVTQLLRIEPLLEQAHRDKMLLLARTGQRPLALQQYQTAVSIFDEELGIDLSPETAVLYERIEQLTLPTPCILPARRRHFVGRAAELATVQAALVDTNRRLITLAGTGGMGKTRLAQEVARRLHADRPGHFLDGIYFVELASVSAAEASTATIAETIATQIAQTVALPLHGDQPAMQQLLSYLQGRELLLILDNLEQLVDTAVDSIVDLLQQAPDLTLLVTSRERLNLYEETVLTLGGLPTPTTDTPTADQTEAVQLFLHNVRQHNLNFTATADALAAMATICRLVDGVPLAIELAAGWVRHDSMAEIARQIEQNAAFLATDLRNVPARHRSLRAVFDHSWDLLPTDLRPILAHLSVFPGHFNAATATAIAGADKRALHTLVDKSLLQKLSEDTFAIHPLLRQFAAEQLDETAQTAVSDAHAHYFAQQLAANEADLHGAEELDWLAYLRTILPDLRAAWHWATDRQQTTGTNENGAPSSQPASSQQDAGAPFMQGAMLYSLAHLYDVEGLYREGIGLFATAEHRLVQSRRLDQSSTDYLRGRLLSWIGRFHYHIGQYDEARAALETALALLRPLNKPDALALALTYRGEVARFEADFDAARRYQVESITLAQAAGATQVEILALLHTGKIEIAEGKYRAAQQACESGLALARQAGGPPRLIALFEDNLGTVYLELGNHETAQQKFLAAYALRQTLDDRWGLGISLNNLGVLALITGDYEAATDNYRQAQQVFQEIGYRWGAAMALTNLGRAFGYRQQYESARRRLHQAQQLWQAVGSQLGEGDCWLYLGQIALFSGAYEEARTWLNKSLALFTQIEDERQLPLVWRDLGVTLARLGEMETARAYLRRSLDTSVAEALTPDVVYALSGWAIWLHLVGKTAVAAQLLSLAATHPASWHHERAEAQRLLAEVGGPDAHLPALTLETAVGLIKLL
jgi:predicted ATPase/Flp pilus assembly protein TadD